MSNVDINVDRRMDGRTENRTPISHPATSRCDKKQEICFLRSACHLMLIDIYVKFCEDSLNGSQVIERTQFCVRVQGK